LLNTIQPAISLTGESPIGNRFPPVAVRVGETVWLSGPNLQSRSPTETLLEIGAHRQLHTPVETYPKIAGNR